MALNDYQFQYITTPGGDTVNMGENGATVPTIDMIEVRGLLDMEARVGDREFARQSGDIPGLHRATPRFINLRMEIRGDPADTAYKNLVIQARDVFTVRTEPFKDVTDGKLGFQWPGEVTQFIIARPIRRRMTRDARTEYGIMPLEVELRGANPRIYADSLTTPSAQSGTFNVTNLGNTDAYPILDFGSVATVSLLNNTNNDQISITGATGAGNLIADMDRWIRGEAQLFIVYRETTPTDNYSKWIQPREPFRLQPGINSLTLNTGTNVVVKHRDTWL